MRDEWVDGIVARRGHIYIVLDVGASTGWIVLVFDWLDAEIFVEDLIHEGGKGKRGDGEQEKMSRSIMSDDREKDEKPDSVWVKGHEGVGWMITI